MDWKTMTFEDYLRIVCQDNIKNATQLDIYKNSFYTFKKIMESKENTETNTTKYLDITKDNPHLRMDSDLLELDDPLLKTRNEIIGQLITFDELRASFNKDKIKHYKINYSNHAICIFCNASLDHGEQCDCEEVRRRREHVTGGNKSYFKEEF